MVIFYFHYSIAFCRYIEPHNEIIVSQLSEDSDQHPPSLIRIFADPLLPSEFTAKTDQTGQMYRLICVFADTFHLRVSSYMYYETL